MLLSSPTAAMRVTASPSLLWSSTTHSSLAHRRARTAMHHAGISAQHVQGLCSIQSLRLAGKSILAGRPAMLPAGMQLSRPPSPCNPRQPPHLFLPASTSPSAKRCLLSAAVSGVGAPGAAPPSGSCCTYSRWSLQAGQTVRTSKIESRLAALQLQLPLQAYSNLAP